MRNFIHTVFLYIVFLLLIPTFIYLTTSCFTVAGPQEYEACTIATLSNQYLKFMGLGALIAGFAAYLYGKNTEQQIKSVILIVMLLILLGVFSYYLYLPFALKQIGEVEIFLDTLLE